MRESSILIAALFALTIGVGVFIFSISTSNPSTGLLISSGACVLMGAFSTYLATKRYQESKNKKLQKNENQKL